MLVAKPTTKVSAHGSQDPIANILKEKTAPSQNQNSKSTVRFSPSLDEPRGSGNWRPPSDQEGKVEGLSQQSITQEQPSVLAVILVTLNHDLGPLQKKENLRDIVLGLPTIPLSQLPGMWAFLTPRQTIQIADVLAEIMSELLTADPSTINLATEPQWIARFLLFFITMPEPSHEVLEWCEPIWASYVNGNGCPGVRQAICGELKLAGWQPALQAAFLDNVYPAYLKLATDKRAQLRRQHGSEIFQFMESIRAIIRTNPA